ncbi:MAG: WD40 repeat domain-containing protein [Gammaproteobacteria bacterium]|nr:WD40 repeat domain-containing protein [Gammaproteobacteria bacterium]
MNVLKTLFVVSFACAWYGVAQSAHAADDDIYAVQFSEDGKFLVTGGSGGNSPQLDYSGGIKLWDVEHGTLVKAFGAQGDIDNIFGAEYSPVGKRRWGIDSFKDIVMTGSYPNGKVVLLPSSLGRLDDASNVQLPNFIGGYMDLASAQTDRIPLEHEVAAARTCGDTNAAYEYIGPVVASENGRYAAVVVNTCKQKMEPNIPVAQYDSTVHVMDLRTLKITKSFPRVDSGIYAAGVTDNGERVAFVGRDRFAVMDTQTGTRHEIEKYENAVFQLPRQFSSLYFNDKGNKLVSLHFVYDIETGKETEFAWKPESAVNKGRTASMKVAPDLSYFVLVKPKKSLVVFGEDGLPRSYGKSDRVIVVDTKTGGERELAITDSRTEGKRCVTDISPDSRHVAVACMGGIIKVFDVASGKIEWEQRNVGYKAEDMDKNLIHVRGIAEWMQVAQADTAW